MITVGLTGSIGTGKSTVTEYLLKKGYNVIDTDKISRDVVEIGETGYQNLVDYFGEDILGKDKNIERKKLSEIVFSNKEKLESLNSILHPIIINEIFEIEKSYKNKGASIIFIDAPLLIESGLYKEVDKVLLISCSEDIQIQRIMHRDNISQLKAKSIIDAQMSFDKKKAFADFILMNDESKDKLYEKLEVILKKLKKV